MLFNSYPFLLAFFPATLFVFLLLGRWEQPRLAISWLIAASLFFYGWWNPAYLILIIGSILFNYSIGSVLSKGNNSTTKGLLLIGIIGNLSLLGYFKYYNFFIENINYLFHFEFTSESIILPLAISFFTFQQIAYLVDAYRGETEEYNFLHYCLFVTFFPQLIAGPIVHHKEMMPQFNFIKAYRFRADDFSIGFTILIIGLFKKVGIVKSNVQVKYIYWTNEFANKTGLSITAINIDKLSIEELVSSEAFQLHPPKAVIYQSVERGIKGRLKRTSNKTCRNLFTPKVDALPVNNMSILASDYKLIRKIFWLDYETNVYVARHKIKDIFKVSKAEKVKIIPLKSAAPFSSKEKKKLLILKDDFTKEKLSQQRLYDMQCTLLNFQNKVQKNGYTAFFTMISPDKLSMYDHLAVNNSIVNKSSLEELELNKEINWINVGVVLSAAIERGQMDIYRPNDTHWGSAGGELVSNTVISQLQSQGILHTINTDE